MIEKATFKIKGEEIICLKPYACDIIDVEDQSYGDSGTFDVMVYSRLMLGLVTDKYKIEDLVEFDDSPLVLSSGEKISPKKITFDEFIKTTKEADTRTKACKAFLKLCGVEGEISLKDFSYKDITAMASALNSIYDDRELSEVIRDISNFCLSSEDIEE